MLMRWSWAVVMLGLIPRAGVAREAVAPEGFDATLRRLEEASAPATSESTPPWTNLLRMEAATLTLLPRKGEGTDEGFVQLEPLVALGKGESVRLILGAPVRLRLWGGGEGAGLVRKEDWDTLSDWGQVVRLFMVGGDTPHSVWLGMMEGYSLLSGHLVRRYGNRVNPDAHPAGVIATGTLGPVYAEAFASDVLSARLMGAEVALDVEHVLFGRPPVPGRYTLALSAVHDWERGGDTSRPQTLAHLDATAVVLRRGRKGQRLEAHLVGEWGEAGAMALHEARGNVAQAQATLAVRYREPPTAASAHGGAGRRSGSGPSVPPEAAGLPAEVAEAKFQQWESEFPGERLSMDVAELTRHLQALREVAPAQVKPEPLWGDYVAYLETRAAEIKKGLAEKGPLKWAGYQLARDRYARGLAFEKKMVALLEADAALPRAQRRWLKDFDEPHIVTHVGVAKPDVAGVRFADVLVIEGKPRADQPPRVEAFSFKSRDLKLLKEEDLKAQMRADANDALRYYGDIVDIRRPELMRRGLPTQIQRLRLVYEGGVLKPRDFDMQKAAVRDAQAKVKGVEVSVQ